MTVQQGSLKSILTALLANLLIAIIKTAGAIITGSGTLFAESIHSFADCGNQVLLFWGLKTSEKPPSASHPMGYGRAIYFWSFIVSLLLFSIGGLFSIFEGMHKLENPQEMENPLLAIVILVFSIFIEGWALMSVYVVIKKIKKDKSLWQWFKGSRNSELFVVLAEDMAAVAGLLLALIFIGIYMLTGNPIYDALGSMAIGILLVLVAFILALEIKSLLIGEGIPKEVQDKIYNIVNSDKNVIEILNILSMQLGRDRMIAIQAVMQETNSVEKLVSIINKIEEKIRAEEPEIKWVFFEPDRKK